MTHHELLLSGLGGDEWSEFYVHVNVHPVTVHRVTVHRNKFHVIKPTRCTNFTNLFCHESLHVSDSSSVHHQEFIRCTLSIGICHTAFEQDQSGTAVPS